MRETDTYASAADKFTAFLESRRLRRTQERYAILKRALDYDGHFEADSLHGDLEKEGYHVSRGTVYNTLDLLCQCGIITRLLFDPHQASYERSGQNHCHLICTQCGQVTEINDDTISGRLDTIKLPTFIPAYFTTCIYGVCSKCARKSRQAAKNRTTGNKRNNNKN